MTLVLHKPEIRPATHAFVVGVGRYTFLDGGAHPAAKVAGWGLKQLSSPPLSATAIADFLLGELDNPKAPLGSVELLLSPEGRYRAPTGGASHAVDPATTATSFPTCSRAFWFSTMVSCIVLAVNSSPFVSKD